MTPPVTHDHIYPATGRPNATVTLAGAAEIHQAVAAAQEAQREWIALTVDRRRDLLIDLADVVHQHLGELAALNVQDYAVPISFAGNAILLERFLRHFAGYADKPHGSSTPVSESFDVNLIEREPYGVVGVIAPWNGALVVAGSCVAPALAAGNAVVFKPSEHAPRTAAFVGSLFAAHLPPDVLQVVQGGPAEGEALIRAGVDFLVFTGSRAGGEAVSRLCAEALTPAALELGAKDAAIVLADADIPRAAAGILWGAFGNSGQNCAAVERCYVLSSVAGAFVEALEQELVKLRVGTDGEGEFDVGPLATEAQKSIVDAHLKEAEKRSIRTLQGRRVEGKLGVTPTILVDPPPDLTAMREETFGPVLPVMTVPSEEEAVAAANESPFGLTVSVWSKDLARAERLGRQIDAGVVTINNHAFTGGLADAPWGGVRGSGFGTTNGPETLEQLTRPRLVLVDKGTSRRELWWYPYDRGLLRLSRGMTRFRAGGGGFGAVRDIVGGWLERRKGVR